MESGYVDVDALCIFCLVSLVEMSMGCHVVSMYISLVSKVTDIKSRLELWRAHTPRTASMFMYELHPMGCTCVTYANVHIYST